MDSHTSLLVDEAFEKIQEFNYKRYIHELKSLSDDNPKQISSGRKHTANQILEKFGLHLSYKNKLNELLELDYSKMGKWSSAGTLMLALKNPEKFDEVYELLSDDDSKATFDWFVRYRSAYAVLGELACEIFPPKIAKEEFLKEASTLKVNNNGLIKLRNYIFESTPLETTQSWIFEQYYLDGKCEVSNGDFVIDGSAYKGETSLWFLSKGAGKVYAFEADPNNYSILVENIKRNKASEEIIPVPEVLSNRVGQFSFYTTVGGGSTVKDGGNKTVKGITLDSFVAEKDLKRVDFIKLDVEGAELEILEGAVHTIKKFKPKMSISVYHKSDDIILIPHFLRNILPETRFYLSHKFYNWNETILFVNPRERGLR